MHANLGVTTLDEIAEKFAETAEVEKKYADKQKHLILSPKRRSNNFKFTYFLEIS